jgi:hypothetical protein
VAAGWAASEQEYNFVPTGTETDVSIRLDSRGFIEVLLDNAGERLI